MGIPLRIGCVVTLLGLGGATNVSPAATNLSRGVTSPSRGVTNPSRGVTNPSRLVTSVSRDTTRSSRDARVAGGLDFFALRFETGDEHLPLPADGSSPFVHDPGSLLTATLSTLERNRDSLVHLETLRRALRASIQSDGENAFGFTRAMQAQLCERALLSSARGAGDALAWLDAGIATIVIGQQYGTFSEDRVALVEKAAALAPADGGIRLVAGIVGIALGGQTRWQDHLSAAAAASASNPNLRKTLDGLPPHFRPGREGSAPASRQARR